MRAVARVSAESFFSCRRRTKKMVAPTFLGKKSCLKNWLPYIFCGLAHKKLKLHHATVQPKHTPFAHPFCTPLLHKMSDDWLQKHTRSVLADVKIPVKCRRAQEVEEVTVTLHVKAIELDYGPCIQFSATVDIPFESKGWFWDDHPFGGALKHSDSSEPVNSKPVKGVEGATLVTSVGDIVDDTPAVRALIQELADPAQQKLYVGTDATHRARLIMSIRAFWA